MFWQDEVYKNSREPFMMSGCKVADDSGSMLVTSVGINTEWGLLMASISEDTGEETPLQVRLNGITPSIESPSRRRCQQPLRKKEIGQ
ncbi:calcium-transporting ATPase putative [Euphorbia peplus]|nr:calcium-transporting ATPase putative [Euphorbia peplus]